MQKYVYIYSISEPDSKIVRYVGKTKFSLEKRLKQHLKEKVKCHRYYWIQSIIKKGKVPIIQIIDEVPEDNWQFWEMYWIEQFKNWGFNLVNSTNGGDGIDGFKHSKETIELLRKLGTGRKHSKETIEILKNLRHSEKTKKIIAKKLSLPIIQLDLNGRLIKKWNSSKEVIKDLGVCSGSISDCLNNKTKSCNGFVWLFESEYNSNKNYKIPKEKRYRKKIVQSSLDGKIIKVWTSIRDASIKLKIKDSNISLCCKGKRKTTGGFMWRYF